LRDSVERRAGNRIRASVDDRSFGLHSNPVVTDLATPMGGFNAQRFAAEQVGGGSSGLDVLQRGQDPFLDFLGNVESLDFDSIFNDVNMGGEVVV
jgi:hypothetical protein